MNDTILNMVLDIRGALKALEMGYRSSLSASFDELVFALKKTDEIIMMIDPSKIEDINPSNPVLPSLKEIAELYLDIGGEKVLFNFKTA